MEIDTGDTAWVLVSAAMVLLMTPGLALFYGGMVRSKSVLNMMLMSFASLGVIGVLWVLYGYSMTFGSSVGDARIVGNPLEYLGLEGLMSPEAVSGTIPTLAFVSFQAVFAIIAVALISGAIADRARFGTWIVFTVIWATLVYFPVAHWVFAFDATDDAGTVTTYGGWIANVVEALDFAGGTAIHINAGAAALALVLVVGKRIGFQREPMRPHNLPLVMAGAGLLWFGWFGFNAGSALGAGTLASVAFVNTIVATSAAILGWLLLERLRDGHPTSLGAASGVVAGLVAITPAANSVSPVGALLIGLIAGVVCALAVGLKYRFGYDDSLDVVGVHLVGGLVGTLLIGFFAHPDSPAEVAGLFYGGGLSQLGKQAIGAFAVLIYSFVVTLLIALLLKAVMGWRVSAEAETDGIDGDQHAESGYDLHPLRGGSGMIATASALGSSTTPSAAAKEEELA
ncbi:ammonium transporter [Auraticoccus monumenti]|uniref:Ammonium transporter n=1 Tax=Auraticoccus monumenti TaxID=675864 RepID=A0A1G7E2D9_9ACTN|nr:ammonium transporter [Auraticoccus monumenti]SDE57801.1 ammonium transporter [Auraticoccus monumenti]